MSTAAQARRYREGWDDERRTYHREWARSRRQRLGAIAGLVDNHGLSLARAREIMASKPERCDICARKARLCYDHDHSTKQFRGWLCYRCNHGLHMLDDPELLAAAMQYREAACAAL